MPYTNTMQEGNNYSNKRKIFFKYKLDIISQAQTYTSKYMLCTTTYVPICKTLEKIWCPFL